MSGVQISHHPPSPPRLPELLVIRHGETEWNREGRWQGALDSPLTTLGKRQAREIGGLLADMGVTPRSHEMRVSPQGRARATARLISQITGHGLFEDDRLREIGVGEFAGRTREEILAETGLGPEAHFLEAYARAPLGETFEEVMARVSDLLADLSRPTVLVTHGITSRFLRTAALGLGLDRIDEVPGGQGVVHRIRDGRHDTLDARGPEA